MSQAEPNTNITLPDGRTLSYLLAGADSGPVVTVLDGPCSRGLGRALAATARELGIRLVIPDRPASHGSTPKPGRTVADWPADHLAEVVQIPWVKELFVPTTAELFANPDGFIEEVRILCKPWGITPGAVRASLWTGEFDRMHPPSHARRVAELLGGDPPVTVVPGVEQIGLLAIFEEALRFATLSGP